MAELLNEDELASVTGGKKGEYFSARLIGPYYKNSKGEGGENTLAVGWSDLKIEYAAPGSPYPYRISDKDGPIGWTCRANIAEIGKGK